MKGILIDVTRCRGCNRCVEACAEENRRIGGGGSARFSRGGLDANHLSAIVPLGDEHFVRQGCVHCLEPACEAACLVGALNRTPEGPVVYDAEKCIGCRYCMLACPFSVPRYEWDRTAPLIRKCEMCHERPGGPACVEACPHAATVYGDREELLAIASERMRERPGQYMDRIWGAEDTGGTAVLILSDVPLDPIWPEALGEESIPEMVWPFVRATPFLFGGVAGTLSALSFIIHRRNKLRGGSSDPA